jgi:hypothetical protein
MMNRYLTEIPRAQWAEFVNEFSQYNWGRLTRLEIFGELGAQEEERRLPLNGVTLDLNGHDAPRLAIMLGENTEHLTHTITQVTRLFPKRAVTGKDEALEIEDANGEKTLLQFEAQ